LIEQRVVTHVERSEYLKEKARIAAAEVLEDADLSEALLSPEEFTEELLALLLIVLGPLAAEMKAEARDYAQVLGLRKLAEDDDEDEEESRFILIALPLLTAALLPIRDLLERMDDAALSEETIAAALAAAATRQALLSSLESAAKRAAAQYLSDVARGVMEAALTDFIGDLEWIAVMDGNTCDDVFANSCAPRHAEVGELAVWDLAGHPGAPNLLCSIYSKGTSNCRCQLADAALINPKLLNPVNVTAAIVLGRERARVMV
jgi:hypothetical protein